MQQVECFSCCHIDAFLRRATYDHGIFITRVLLATGRGDGGAEPVWISNIFLFLFLFIIHHHLRYGNPQSVQAESDHDAITWMVL